MAAPLVSEALRELGFTPKIRMKDASNRYITDEGNLILDCTGLSIADPHAIATELDAMVGVVEHGLFLDMADLALIADTNQVIESRT
jgi:ribose 5-phosphate isomerase A